jgi:hypothetical protein
MPTCTPEENKEVFGPISRFVMEGEDPDQPVQFRSGPVVMRTQLDQTGIRGMT